VAKADAYTLTMRIMAVLLLVGFLCNALVRPVEARFAEDDEEARTTGRDQRRSIPVAPPDGGLTPVGDRSTKLELLLAWTVVGVPLTWGVSQVFRKSLDLFR
jgi:hypothetical protein